MWRDKEAIARRVREAVDDSPFASEIRDTDRGEAIDWIIARVQDDLQRINARSELTYADKPEIDLDDANVVAVLEDVEAWILDGPDSFEQAVYELWLTDRVEWLSQIAPDADFPVLDSRPFFAEVLRHLGSWDCAVGVALGWIDSDREEFLEQPRWWDDAANCCESEGRSWKFNLYEARNVHGYIPDLEVPDIPIVPCRMEQGHDGMHCAGVGLDEYAQGWYLVWEENGTLGQSLVEARGCTVLDGSSAYLSDELIRVCSLVSGHTGFCRFESWLSPLVLPIDDFIPDLDVTRMFWDRLRDLGIEPSPVFPSLWLPHDDASGGWLDFEVEEVVALDPLVGGQEALNHNYLLLVELKQSLGDLDVRLDRTPDLECMELEDSEGNGLDVSVSDSQFAIGASFTLDDGGVVSELVGSVATADLAFAAAEVRRALAHLVKLKEDPEAVF